MTDLPEPPDFDEMISLSKLIGYLLEQVALKDIEIKEKESKIVQKVTTDPAFFKNGKALAMNVIEVTFQFGGFNGELVEPRKELAILKARLEQARLQFEVMQGQIKIYQTKSSNIRGALL